jgi:glyoxylase-like metal-dependent hydrolase (beta-lactamase superfamily II)
VNSVERAPARISVRMYQVGFGDCFLLSFHYSEALEDGREQRHLLIDFGSTRWPEGHPGRYPEIAADIEGRTGGRLDAIVISHRHKDHISGYGNDGAADLIGALQPSLVLRP